MEGIIRVSPEKLIESATEFETQGGNVQSVTSSMLELAQGINSAWEGDAAESFKNRFSELSDDMERMYSMIREHVQDLNEMAANYAQYETEGIDSCAGLNTAVIE